MTQIAFLAALIAILVVPVFILLSRRRRRPAQVVRVGKDPFDVSPAYEFAPLSPYAVDQISSDRDRLLEWLKETRRRMRGLLLWHLREAHRNFRFSGASELRLLSLYLRLAAVGAYLHVTASAGPARSEEHLARVTRLVVGLADAIWSRYTVLLIEMAHPQDDQTGL